jgi:glycosyltransferase involved in cell wall biosynthesis
MPPLVSIIIPCLNAAPWLAKTISSCLSQTYQNIEVMFVDNGSSDGSVEIAKQFEGPKLLIAYCERKGASAARNEGLHRAQGNFIQYLDADDILASDKIEIQINKLAESPQNTIANGAWARFKNDPSEAVFEPEAVWRDCSPQEFLISSWLGGGMMPLFGWLSPRLQVTLAGLWDESLSVNDDGDYFTRVALASSGITFCGNAKGFYRTQASSTLSQRADREAAESDFKAIHQSCNHLLAIDDSIQSKRACATAYQRLVYRYYPDHMALTRRAEQMVSQLGGSNLAFGGGWRAKIVCSLLGWKAAKRLQHLKYRKMAEGN